MYYSGLEKLNEMNRDLLLKPPTDERNESMRENLRMKSQLSAHLETVTLEYNHLGERLNVLCRAQIAETPVTSAGNV